MPTLVTLVYKTPTAPIHHLRPVDSQCHMVVHMFRTQPMDQVFLVPPSITTSVWGWVKSIATNTPWTGQYHVHHQVVLHTCQCVLLRVAHGLLGPRFMQALLTHPPIHSIGGQHPTMALTIWTTTGMEHIGISPAAMVLLYVLDMQIIAMLDQHATLQLL